MLVVYRGKVTLGVYHDNRSNMAGIKRGWRIAVTPGARWEVVRNPNPTAWASLPSYKPPQQTRTGQAAIPAFRHHQRLALPALLRAHHPRLGSVVGMLSGHVFLNCIACGWNTSVSTADPRKIAESAQSMNDKSELPPFPDWAEDMLPKAEGAKPTPQVSLGIWPEFVDEPGTDQAEGTFPIMSSTNQEQATGCRARSDAREIIEHYRCRRSQRQRALHPLQQRRDLHRAPERRCGPIQ